MAPFDITITDNKTKSQAAFYSLNVDSVQNSMGFPFNPKFSFEPIDGFVDSGLFLDSPLNNDPGFTNDFSNNNNNNNNNDGQSSSGSNNGNSGQSSSGNDLEIDIEDRFSFRSVAQFFETKRITCSFNSISSISSSKLFLILVMEMLRSVLSIFVPMACPLNSSVK